MSRKKKRVGWATKVGIAAFAVYTACMLVSLQLHINDASRENENLRRQKETRTLVCAELNDAIYGDNQEEYIEEIARDSLGYVYPGEQVYVDISSK